MLIEFEVGNFLSFRDPVRLSMAAATPIKEFKEDNVFDTGRHRLLKSGVVYGANASGKSNLMSAFVNMRWFVLNSSRETQANEPIGVTPFKLDADSEIKPSRFEARLVIDGVTYRYGYEVDGKRVHAEWLFEAKKIAETELFIRRGGDIEVMKAFSEGHGLEEKTRGNALFLSVVAQFNGAKATRILSWFSDLQPLHGLHSGSYVGRSIEILQDPSCRERLLQFVRQADLGIESMSVAEEELDAAEALRFLSEERRRRFLKDMADTKMVSVAGVHPKYKDGVRVGATELDLDGEESAGTQKFFHLAGPILDCLDQGRVIIVDELDARLHPNLTCAVVRLFNSRKTNPRNAQLIFCTHDTNLLSCGGFRRDQVWFVEKNGEGATGLYSLAEMKVRNDAALQKNYIRGRYGAVPFLGDFADAFAGRPGGETDKVQ